MSTCDLLFKVHMKVDISDQLSEVSRYKVIPANVGFYLTTKYSEFSVGQTVRPAQYDKNLWTNCSKKYKICPKAGPNIYSARPMMEVNRYLVFIMHD